MTGLCGCGCGTPTRIAEKTDRSRGWVKGEPLRFIAGHQCRRGPDDYLVDLETGCWVWQRHVAVNGYGRGRRARYSGSRLAHRVYYEEHVGPVPDGLEIDHLCQNRRCVNPAHLEAVTRSENMLRGRGPRNAKLTAEEVREIRVLRGLFSLKEIAARFGVSVSAIKHIHYGQRWSDVA